VLVAPQGVEDLFGDPAVDVDQGNGPCGTASVPAGQPEAAGGAVEILNSTIVGKVRSGEFKLVANSIFIAALAAGDNWPAPVRSEK
jgi:hypothetical protein